MPLTKLCVILHAKMKKHSIQFRRKKRLDNFLRTRNFFGIFGFVLGRKTVLKKTKKTNNKAKTAIKIHDMWKEEKKQVNNFKIIHIRWGALQSPPRRKRNGRRKLTVLC